MDASAWPESNWAALGEAIAKARRAKGWDQAGLAQRSGNSPNTISNYERGRATRSRRIPPGLHRVAQVFGWPPDAVERILNGEDPELALEAPRFNFDLQDAREEMPSTASVAPPRLMSGRDIELTSSGHVAQDTFIRQMKRYRKLKGVTPEEMVTRVTALGGDINLDDLTRLENGTRLLRMSEAQVLAAALDTDVQWLLGSGFQDDVPNELTAPPSSEELEAEAKAVERRLFETGTQMNQATMHHAHALERVEAARREADMARLLKDQVSAQMAELERQYHYLIGRIDSLRAAKGEEQIIQTFPVMEEMDETIGGRLKRARKAKGLTLEQVQATTRIRVEILKALEANDFDVLDDGSEERQDVYARGHIRTLARTYGLASGPLVDEYDETHARQLSPRLRQWRHVEETTGRQYRPRKRGAGFVTAEKPRYNPNPEEE